MNELHKVNYFEFFCLPQLYDLDMTELNAHYKQYQKYIHPDKFQMAENQLQENSHFISAYANNAYFTLINDLQRAVYLLRLKGVCVLQESD